MFIPRYSIWFWQRILTPHMASLAEALAKRGYSVIFVANKILSKKRLNQGWEKPSLGKVKFKLAKYESDVIRLAKKAPKNSIHLTQGLFRNGLVTHAQKILRHRGLRHWAMLEKINDEGWKGKVRRILYKILFLYWGNHLEGVLAIGCGMKNWVVAQGMKKTRVQPFAYFLKTPKIDKKNFYEKSVQNTKNRPYRFIFVGQLIKRKRVDLLIKAISALKLKNFELWIVGDGPEKENLKFLAKLLLANKVRWFGKLNMSKIGNILYQADNLILPSMHDGWGAVTSEALMVGTPVICSNTCGSSVIVKASGVGGVFLSNNQKTLMNNLYKQYKIGLLPLRKKKKITKWARCLNDKSGAEYLDLILNRIDKSLIKVPWKN